MTATLRHLQSLVGNQIIAGVQAVGLWQFSDKLAQKNTEFFRPLVRKHWILQFEYDVLCSQLMHNYAKLEHQKDAQLINQLVSALIMAELLAHIYQYYLGVPREVERLNQEQAIYRSLLEQYGFQFKVKGNENLKTSSLFTQKISAKTLLFNWPRMLSLRTKRVIDLGALMAKNKQRFSHSVTAINKYVNPAIAYFNCIFYVPRLLSNVIIGIKHLVPNPLMASKEKELDFMTRLIAQLHRRWFELSNDGVWVIAALLNCFLFTGALAPIGMYLTIILFAYDVVLVAIRAYLELSRIKTLQAEYQKINASLSQDKHNSAEELAETEEYLTLLQRRFAFEQKRLLLSVVTTTALFFAMCFTAPVLLANPIIPLIGASLIVIITLISYILNRKIQAQRPSDNILHLTDLKQSFFCQKAKDVTTSNKEAKSMVNSWPDTPLEPINAVLA